ANFFEPVTFVLSPTLTKFVSGRITRDSRPANLKYGLITFISFSICVAQDHLRCLLQNRQCPWFNTLNFLRYLPDMFRSGSATTTYNIYKSFPCPFFNV